ncbi:nucleoside-diphosphate kinase [Streptomyces anulatus]|uniref:nucleoside-diphosphate kinase n=1 Tax=Streptomyces anulatus TaxID=1892 RepID=UPI001C27011A|nr:nucleoside-diphosphate kinase [Streptomyces anulatus]
MPPLRRLTDVPEKRELYAMDPLAREGWATLAGVLGEREGLGFARETGVLWLRPDAAASGMAEAVVERISAAGFVPLGARVVRLSRGDVRALWWWHLKRATAERLLLLDAVAELGPGLVVLYRHPEGDPARRLTALKGANDPAGRSADTLRSLANSPNRLLTMVHTSDDPADVVRELAVFLPWRERAALVASAWANVPGSPSLLEGPLAAVRASYRGCPQADAAPSGFSERGEAFAALVRDTSVQPMRQRWAALQAWSRRAPLLAGGAQR